jgi:hypothetical protein
LPYIDTTQFRTAMLGYGGGMDAGWYWHGRTSHASINYVLGYNGNATYEALNGFDHDISLSWNKSVSRRLSYSLIGMAQSTTVSGFLFQKVSNPAAGSSADPANAGSTAGAAPPVQVPGATNTILSPARRNTAMLAATLSYAASPRLSWNVTLHGQRLLPSSDNVQGGQATMRYRGGTDGSANVSVSYALSRRTSVGSEMTYSRTFSTLSTIQVGSAAVAVSRTLSRAWFSSAAIGYGLGAYSLKGTGASVRRYDLTGRGTIGASFESSTLTASVAERMGDSYGFGAARTWNAEIAGNWHPKRGHWSFQSSAGYERMTGLLVNVMQAAIFRAGITRKLSANVSCGVDGGYAWGNAQGSASLGQHSQDGFRLSLIWHPAVTFW